MRAGDPAFGARGECAHVMAPRARTDPRLRLGVGHDRRARSAARHALRPQHNRARDRWHDRHRHPRHCCNGRRRERNKLSHELASGISDAFLAAGAIAGTASLIALLILPAAASFLPQAAARPTRRSPLGVPDRTTHPSADCPRATPRRPPKSARQQSECLAGGERSVAVSAAFPLPSRQCLRMESSW